MLVKEYKLAGTPKQYAAIDEALRITQFIRNKCLRKWMDDSSHFAQKAEQSRSSSEMKKGQKHGISANDLQCSCAVLAKEYSFASLLNSQARQVAADRAWSAIQRFYDHCREKKPGKKGYPQFQHDNRSVEYKNTGWKLEPDGKHLTFTDGCGIGKLRLVGNNKQKVAEFPIKQIKRVRIVKRADGYYAQLCVQSERKVEHVITGAQVGVDVGLKEFYTDSNGNTIANPRFLRKAEKKLKRLHRRLFRQGRPSRTQKKSANRKKARQKLAKAYLKVNRRREDFARKTANALVSSHDLIAVEDLKIANLVKNHHLAKSISDAAWGRFLEWVRYYSIIHAVPVVAVAPHWTSQKCSGCGQIVKKSLSERTHSCVHCGLVLERDENAARNILALAQEWLKEQGCTGGHSETGTPRRVRNASGQKTTTASQK